MATLHYTSGANFDPHGNYTPGEAGFNLADVQSVAQLNALPEGVKGLVWLNMSDGVTPEFKATVSQYANNPNLFGFFLVDEPDPTGNWGKKVSAADLKAESDWIHANIPGAKTFITMMNLGSSENPNFSNSYTPENTHIDYFGLDPYPVRSGGKEPDLAMIDHTVAAAEAAGIPPAQMIPVYQTFGGGGWRNDEGGSYVMPTSAQMQGMLNRWGELLPSPAFDYAYSWGTQNGDQALSGASALQEVFHQHNLAVNEPVGNTTPVGTPDPVPADNPSIVPPAAQDTPPAAQADPPAAQDNPPAVQADPPAAQNNPPAAQDNPPVAQADPPSTTADNGSGPSSGGSGHGNHGSGQGFSHGNGSGSFAPGGGDISHMPAHHPAGHLQELDFSRLLTGTVVDPGPLNPLPSLHGDTGGTAAADLAPSHAQVSHHAGLDLANLHGLPQADAHSQWHW